MVPFLAFAMAGIFSSKDLRSFAVVIVITVALCQEPAFGTIEMLIHQIHFQIFHFRPYVIKVFTFRLRSRTTNNLDFRMSLTKHLDKLFQTFRIFRSPLFVTNAQEFQVKGSRVSHIRTNFSPSTCDIAISKLNQV